MYVTKKEITQRMTEIDNVFNTIGYSETFLKFGNANDLRNEWVSLYNRLASMEKH